MRPVLLLAICGCGDNFPATIDAATDGGADAVTTCAPSPGWTPAPALARGPTQETATVAVAGKVYVLGGFDENLGILSTVQVFDAATCEWSMGPALPRPVHHANATTVGTTIWLTGAAETLNFTPVGHVWSWDPTTAATAWTEHAPMPAGTERGSAAIAAIGSTIYVAGGLRSASIALAHSLDTTTLTWTALPALPAVRDHGCGAVVAGKLYVIGGRASANTTSVEELTPGGTWVAKAPMPTGRSGIACGVIGDRIIAVGGEGNAATATGVFAEAEAYRPSTDTWESLAPMPSPRHGMGAAVVGGSLYIPGGADRGGFAAVATHDVLTP
jgi:N-acetylneuraminic acid mutarotase